jgi:hypothetical protein
VEAPGSYRITHADLPLLRAHVIEQGRASESALVERLLGQLASLQVHSLGRGAPGPLSFRPTPATAALAARAFAALEASEPAAMP